MKLCKDKTLKVPITDADKIQLRLYIEGKLSLEEEERIDNLLLNHLEWREADMEVFEELEREKQLKPANNPNYKRFIPLAIASSILLTAGTLPAIKHFPDEVIFKGGFEEKGFIDKTIYYWECRFNEIFGENK